DSAYFSENRERYIQSLDSAMAAWRPKLEALAGRKVVTYHNSWPYFAARFKLNIVGFIEPKPGIPPGPSHLASLNEKLRKEQVPVIIMEPFFDRKTAAKVINGTRTTLVILPSSAGGLPGIDTYFKLIEYNVEALYKAVVHQEAR
ncbi:zinc ABC transporter substrate-binding protein, partial [candidate division TA06 bacterium]|nr:zinc ABC transporter substrate-binding protein [candidate division TA06 bacterium]